MPSIVILQYSMVWVSPKKLLIKMASMLDFYTLWDLSFRKAHQFTGTFINYILANFKMRWNTHSIQYLNVQKLHLIKSWQSVKIEPYEFKIIPFSYFFISCSSNWSVRYICSEIGKLLLKFAAVKYTSFDTFHTENKYSGQIFYFIVISAVWHPLTAYRVIRVLDIIIINVLCDFCAWSINSYFGGIPDSDDQIQGDRKLNRFHVNLVIPRIKCQNLLSIMIQN